MRNVTLVANLAGFMAVEFELNGTKHSVSDCSPTTTLLQYLRGPLAQTGTKEGCAEGDCGACTVALADPQTPGGYRAVNSCLVLLPMVHGQRVVTVEGLGGPEKPHCAQTALVEHLGSQCGYCTPGVVMSMFEATYRDDLDEAWKLDDQMCGNLCRCTGYRPIREATIQIGGRRPEDQFSGSAQQSSQPCNLDYRQGEQRFVMPDTADKLWDILEAEPEARLVHGGTDLSLLVTKRFEELKCVVSLAAIPGLGGIEGTESGTKLGAGLALTDLEAWAKDNLPSVERMLRFFGSRQIKHRATVGGNICNASPIGDLPPILVALGAEAEIWGRKGTRRVSLEDFFVGYRQTVLQPGEILGAVHVPNAPAGDVRVIAYKVAKRQELDISAVAAGLWVHLDEDGVVKDARFVYGGMAATVKRATSVEAAVRTKKWNEQLVESVLPLFDDDFTPIDDHRGSAWYRGTVAKNFLRGFVQETQTNPSPRLPYRPTGTVIEVNS